MLALANGSPWKELAQNDELTGCSKPINYVERSQATLVRNRIGCPERAKQEIGFNAKIDLRVGLKKLIRIGALEHIGEV